MLGSENAWDVNAALLRFFSSELNSVAFVSDGDGSDSVLLEPG